MDEEHREDEDVVWLVEEVDFSVVEAVEDLGEALVGIEDEGHLEAALEEEGVSVVAVELHEGVAVVVVDGVDEVVVVVAVVVIEDRSHRIRPCSHCPCLKLEDNILRYSADSKTKFDKFSTIHTE